MLQATVETMTIFFVLLAIGFAAAKLGIIKGEFMGQLAGLITKIFLPVLIFYATASSVSLNDVKDNLFLLPLSFIVYAALALLAFLVAKIFRIEHDKDRVFQFAFIFGNTGFVGYPLLTSVFPTSGALFMCLFTVIDQLTFWTYGVWLSTARNRNRGKFNVRALISPNTVAVILAVVMIVSGVGFHPLIGTILGTITKAATPLCMIYLGALIYFNNLKIALKRPETYALVIIKMALLPIGACFLATAAGIASDLIGCLTLYIALPVMTVVPMISTQNGDEGPYATGIAVVTFVACIFTIPLVAFICM